MRGDRRGLALLAFVIIAIAAAICGFAYLSHYRPNHTTVPLEVKTHP
jgi:hypothetical protein